MSVDGVGSVTASLESSVEQALKSSDPGVAQQFGAFLFDVGTKLASAGGFNASDIGAMSDVSQLRELIEIQMAFQRQMQEVTMITNSEHTKHESRMAPLRNLRLG